jgi:DNA primase catalytic subunit
LKHDSSIGRGFEIVTAPATLEAHREQWRAFWRSNPTSHLTGYESGSCGMHVHISRPSALVTGKMIVFLNSTENADFVRVIAGRSNSTWAKVCSSKKVTDWNKSYDRYEALNVMNSKTVELRIFRSTLKESSFWKNLEFTHALLHFARTASIDSLTVDSFLAFICQSDNRKQYRNLIAFLVRKGYAMPVKALPLPVKQTEVQLCA